MPALLDDTTHGVLLKEQLASALKQAIVTGRLQAGRRVVETVWPQEVSVAQASVRGRSKGSRHAVWETIEGSIEAHHNGQRSRGRTA